MPKESVARFYAWHAGLPALLALVVLGAFESSDLDRHIQDLFYDPVTKRFPMRVPGLFETVFHDFGRFSVIALASVLVALALWSFRRPALARWRRGFLYAALCLAAGPIAIAQLKHHSEIHCPHSLRIYGGTQPYVRLFGEIPADSKPGHCWPGGHSSGGFAMMSLYFVFRRARPWLARACLAGGFAYGFFLGFTRVVQGSHFLSHNLWAALVCWAVALLLYELILRRHDPADAAPASPAPAPA